MKTYRKTAITVGTLFIIATLAPVLSGVFFFPMENASGLLAHISANSSDVIYGVLLEIIMITAIVSISVIIYPVLSRFNHRFAVGYLSFRIVEVIPFCMGVLCLVLLPALAEQYAQTGASNVTLTTLGTLLLKINDWSYVIAGQLIFGLTALILNLALFQAKLVPRWLSGWGLMGAPLILMAGILELFGPATTALSFTFWVLPIALQEMVFAVWLIVKGFSTSSLDIESSQAENKKFRIARV